MTKLPAGETIQAHIDRAVSDDDDDVPLFEPPLPPSPNADGTPRCFDDIKFAFHYGHPITEAERAYFSAALDFKPAEDKADCAKCADRAARQRAFAKKATPKAIAARKAKAQEWNDPTKLAAIQIWNEKGRLTCPHTIKSLRHRGQYPNVNGKELGTETVRKFLAKLRKEVGAIERLSTEKRRVSFPFSEHV